MTRRLALLAILLHLPGTGSAVPPIDSWVINPPSTAYLVQSYEDGGLETDSSGQADVRPYGSPFATPVWTREDGHGAMLCDVDNGVSAEAMRATYAAYPQGGDRGCMIAFVKPLAANAYNSGGVMTTPYGWHGDYFVLNSLNSDADHYAYAAFQNCDANLTGTKGSEAGVGPALNAWRLMVFNYRRNSITPVAMFPYVNDRPTASNGVGGSNTGTRTWGGHLTLGGVYRTPHATYTYTQSFDGYIGFIARLNEWVSEDAITELYQRQVAGELE